MSVDVIDRQLNSCDLFSFFIRNLGFEFLFQRHYQLNSIQGVGTQIFNERSSVNNFFFFYTQLLSDDFLYALVNVTHISFYFLLNTITSQDATWNFRKPITLWQQA